MDMTTINQRNYRQVEMLRHQNEREQRRLENSLYSKQGIEANRRYSVDNMNREQQLLREELVRLRQTSTTTWGVLPPRAGEQPRSSSKTSIALGGGKRVDRRAAERRRPRRHRPTARDDDGLPEADVKMKGDHSDRGVPRLPYIAPFSPTPSSDLKTPMSMANSDSHRSVEHIATHRSNEPSIADINLEEAKESVARRLSSNSANSNYNDEETMNQDASPLARSGLSPVTEMKEVDTPRVNDYANKDPSIANKDPSIANKDPSIANKDPSIANKDPSLANKDPSLENQLGKVDPKRPNQNKKEDTVNLTKEATGIKKKKKKLVEKQEEVSGFDFNKYNPDGSLRTIHTLPDFPSSLREARKARYLRMKGPQWNEKELSVEEIFKRKSRSNTLVK